LKKIVIFDARSDDKKEVRKDTENKKTERSKKQKGRQSISKAKEMGDRRKEEKGFLIVADISVR
jgi:hypothetical protein